MFVTNWNSTTKIQKISEITNFFRHYFLSRTEVYNEKRMIIKFLKSRGFDYNTVPIPDYVIKRAKDIYPSTWQDYLRMY